MGQKLIDTSQGLREVIPKYEDSLSHSLPYGRALHIAG
jgi:hypothetical protein